MSEFCEEHVFDILPLEKETIGECSKKNACKKMGIYEKSRLCICNLGNVALHDVGSKQRDSIRRLVEIASNEGRI